MTRINDIRGNYVSEARDDLEYDFSTDNLETFPDFLITIPDTHQVKQAIQAECRYGVPGILSHQWLGMESDSHTSNIEHRQIIRAITNGDGLLQRYSFLICD